VDRTFDTFGIKHFWAGFQIGCYNCHNGPDSETATANTPPTVGDLSANTISDTPVDISLAPSDANGNPLLCRIVSQSARGTVALTDTTATYHPAPGFIGTESFTYAAWDGSTDSRLGTVTVQVDSGTCAITAVAFVPLAALPESSVPFRAIATPAQCSGDITYDWDFGDLSAHGNSETACHIYPTAGDYTWTLTASASGVSHSVSGVVTISPTLGPPLRLSILPSDYLVTLLWPDDGVPASLEVSYDPSNPNSWTRYWEEPWLDSTNWTLQILTEPEPQMFRLRRVP